MEQHKADSLRRNVAEKEVANTGEGEARQLGFVLKTRETRTP